MRQSGRLRVREGGRARDALRAAVESRRVGRGAQRAVRAAPARAHRDAVAAGARARCGRAGAGEAAQLGRRGSGEHARVHLADHVHVVRDEERDLQNLERERALGNLIS